MRQKDEELQKLYVERRTSTAATGEEGQLPKQEENPPHFSMWQKIKLGVCMGLVTIVLAMVEMEIEFTDKTHWEMCWIGIVNGTC